MNPLVNIYFSETRREVILAATAINFAGIYYEQDNGAYARPLEVNIEQLGVAIQDSLSQFTRADRNLRTAKQTDWPAFRASRAKSVRDFERCTVYVGVFRMPEGLKFSACSYAKADKPLDILLPLDSSAACIGQTAFDVFRKVKNTKRETD
jgi:uncharacterized protein (DUF1684 family)